MLAWGKEKDSSSVMVAGGLRRRGMLLPFPAPASILTAFIYPHPLLFSISYVITAAASPPPITRLFLSPLPITLLLFYIHPYDSVPLIPWTVSPFPSSKFAFFLWSLNPLLILFALLSTPWSDLTSSPPPICAALGPIPFPLAESPLISIRLPSASEEMKIDSPSSNCSSLVKEKGEAVSWVLSKAVHPSLFEVWRQCCSEISAALTETRGRRVRGEALKQ